MLREFRDLSREEKEDFILSVMALGTETVEDSQRITYKNLSELVESRLHVRIAPSTLGNILRKGSYRAYLLDRGGLDERFRKQYGLQEIEILKSIPLRPNPKMSLLYDAWEKGIPTGKAKEIIEKLEYEGLIEQAPEAQGMPYYNYTRTELGKKLIKAINTEKYKLDLARDNYVKRSIEV